MKAISLWQPWATLIAYGLKRIETRSWSTGYTGRLAIHATRGMPAEAKAQLDREPFRSALRRCGYGGVRSAALPRGQIVAVVTLQQVVGIDDEAAAEALRSHWAAPGEAAFGDYTPGRWGWILRDVERLEWPVECKGAQGLWTVPELVEARIEPLLRPARNLSPDLFGDAAPGIGSPSH